MTCSTLCHPAEPCFLTESGICQNKLEMATEDYEERCAIHEHDAGYSRMTAESMALRYISEKYGKEVARVIYHRA